MATSSTSTKLDVLNRALLAVSERPLTAAQYGNTAFALGQQVQESLRYALARLGQNEWDWLVEYRSTSGTWSLNKFAIPVDVQQVLDVQVTPTNGSITYSIPWVFEEEFNNHDVSDSYTGSVAYPRMFTYVPDNSIAVLPWPSDTTGQNAIRLKIQRFLSPPATVTGTFSIPELYIPLLQLAVNADFCLKYTENTSQAQLYEQQYQELLRQMRARHQSTPTHRMNMYKPIHGGTRRVYRQY